VVGSVTAIVAFHHGNFSVSDYGDATVEVAALAGRFYIDSPDYTGDFGTIIPNPNSSTANTRTKYTWTPKSEMTANVLMVAGGGGGGGAHAAGGGAGGVVYNINAMLSNQQTITVGNGGIGGGHNGKNPIYGAKGVNSLFTGLTSAIGGGGGGGFNNIEAPEYYKNGGSGGGGAHVHQGYDATGGTGISNQGFNGGSGQLSSPWPGGGGGGAGGAGANGSNKGGNGGIGASYISVFGTTFGDIGWFASGGGGSSRGDVGGGFGAASIGGGSDGTNLHSPATDAKKHTGGGGGAGLGFLGSYTQDQYGGNGGSGIVLIKQVPPPPQYRYLGFYVEPTGSLPNLLEVALTLDDGVKIKYDKREGIVVYPIATQAQNSSQTIDKFITAIMDGANMTNYFEHVSIGNGIYFYFDLNQWSVYSSVSPATATIWNISKQSNSYFEILNAKLYGTNTDPTTFTNKFSPVEWEFILDMIINQTLDDSTITSY
jgi:hypothetical protein